MNTSILLQELEPLTAQIEQTREKLGELEDELRSVEAELEERATDKQRFDTLQDICKALDTLGELEASELFWEGLPNAGQAAAHMERLRERIAQFEGEIQGIYEKQDALKTQVNDVHDELNFLQEEVRQAYAREERRLEEFAVVREISAVSYKRMIMPWSGDRESERRFRRALLVAMLLCLFLGILVPLVRVPVVDRSDAVVEIPERLAMLVKKEPPKPEPVPELPKDEEKKTETEEPEKQEEKRPEQEQPKTTTPEAQVARKAAESTGVLAFKSTFADLMEDIPVAKVGLESLSKDAPAAGQARPTRSLVAMQSGGGSSGISTAGLSRNVGSGNADRLGGGGGGVGFARVESSTATGLAEEARPLSSGPGPARTDEEIQIVFDRYKATLYRIYNTELRKNPTLRGKMLLKITIEPGGEVSVCTVESTDLASPELIAQIIDRVKRFNFGPKDDVPKTTILYPIDFLPAG